MANLPKWSINGDQYISLQQPLHDKENQLQDAGTLGQRVLGQQMEQEERTSQLRDPEAMGDGHASADLRERYRELADTVKPWEPKHVKLRDASEFASKTKRRPSTMESHMAYMSTVGDLSREEPGRSIKAGAQSAAQSRHAKNAAHRQNDVEFASEIGGGLLAEVRRLQSLVAEAEKAIQDIGEEKEDLEKSLRAALREKEQNTDKYKEDIWSLEDAMQEMCTQLSDSQASVQRLEGEHKHLTKRLAAVCESSDQYKTESERLQSALDELNANHETDLAQALMHAASLQSTIDELRTKYKVIPSVIPDDRSTPSPPLPPIVPPAMSIPPPTFVAMPSAGERYYGGGSGSEESIYIPTPPLQPNITIISPPLTLQYPPPPVVIAAPRSRRNSRSRSDSRSSSSSEQTQAPGYEAARTTQHVPRFGAWLIRNRSAKKEEDTSAPTASPRRRGEQSGLSVTGVFDRFMRTESPSSDPSASRHIPASNHPGNEQLHKNRGHHIAKVANITDPDLPAAPHLLPTSEKTDSPSRSSVMYAGSLISGNPDLARVSPAMALDTASTELGLLPTESLALGAQEKDSAPNTLGSLDGSVDLRSQEALRILEEAGKTCDSARNSDKPRNRIFKTEFARLDYNLYRDPSAYTTWRRRRGEQSGLSAIAVFDRFMQTESPSSDPSASRHIPASNPSGNEQLYKDRGHHIAKVAKVTDPDLPAAPHLLPTSEKTDPPSRSSVMYAESLALGAQKKDSAPNTLDSLDGSVGLQRHEVEEILDDIQKILDSARNSDEPPNRISKTESALRHQVRHLLYKLTRMSGALPPSLFVYNLVLASKDPVCFGGFADIYRGILRSQEVAIKRLRVYETPGQRARVHRGFCKEALLWRQLSHPFVLPFIGVDRESSPPFMCMVSPWASNGNVLVHLENCRSDSQRVRVDLLIYEIAQGLSYLHDHTIIHGDLRGANIFIDSECHVRLADFGLACFADVTMGTHTSAGRGSLRWMAPELLSHQESEEAEFSRSTSGDVYAFGIVCVELYTQRRPFPNIKNEFRVRHHVCNGGRPERPTADNCWGNAMPDKVWKTAVVSWSHDPSSRPDMSVIVRMLSL